MEAGKKSGNSLSAGRKVGRQILKWGLLVFAGLILLLFFAVPVYVSSQSGRQMILRKVNKAVSGRTDFASLSMGWLSGIKLSDFSYISRDTNTSITAKQIDAKPRYSLLVRNLLFDKSIADNPERLLANLDMKTKLSLDGAEYISFAFGPMELDVQIKNGLLTISPFSTTLNNGTVSFSGSADFRQSPILLQNLEPVEIKDIKIDEQTTHMFLMYVNPVFTNAVNVTGVMNFHCQRLMIPLTGGSKNDLEMVGTIAIDNLRLRTYGLLGQIITLMGASTSGVDMKIHPTRFVLRNGLLSYDDMQLDIGDNPVNFRGTIGLDKSLAMEVTLPYTFMGRTARVGEKTAGERITLPLKGTLDKPELDTGKLLEEQLKKEVFKGLEKLLK